MTYHLSPELCHAINEVRDAEERLALCKLRLQDLRTQVEPEVPQPEFPGPLTFWEGMSIGTLAGFALFGGLMAALQSGGWCL